jgi:hypothetical protein
LPTSVEPGIDPEILFKKIGFDPHSEGQREYLYSDARFNVPCCGRRWGKSQAAGHRMTLKMFAKDTYNWVVGPTYKLGEKEFRVVYNDFKKLGVLKYCKKSYNVKQGDMRIQTPWNSILEVVSAEKPDGLLGEGLSHVIMSESAKHQRSTWEQYIEPALTDLRGTADFPSTPQGFNWFHGLWTLGQLDSHPEYRSWRFPTWTNTARYPGGLEDPEILRIKRLASDIYFNQEYGAMFTAMTGAIYPEWDETVHVQKHVYNPGWANYLAFDYGFANPFVCLDIQVGPSDQVVVWREYVRSYVATMEHGQYLSERTNPSGYKVDGLWGDPRGADEAATLALTYNYVNSFDVPWKQGVEEIKRMLKARPPQLTFDPSCVNTIRSISQLHVKPTTARNVQELQEQTGDRNIQHKVDDHCADALRYYIGPYFVAGAGSHLSDVYGTDYRTSESNDFLTLHGADAMTVGEGIHL